MTLWHAIVRWDRPGIARLRLRIPCSCPTRARWLRRKLGGRGSIQRGTIELTGDAIWEVLGRLGFEEKVMDLVSRYLEERPGQGLQSSWMQQRRQIDALDDLFRYLYGPSLREEPAVAQRVRARLGVARTSKSGQGN